MNRSAVGAGLALVGGLGLALLFWLTAPSVEPATEPPPDPQAQDEIEARARQIARERARQRAEEADEGPGPPALRADEQEDVDPSTVGKQRAGLDGRGSLRRMRTLMRELEAVADEPVPEGLSPTEEDQVLARPIAKKMKILEDIKRDALIQGTGENAVLGARSQLLLSEAYQHTADWMRERPVPSYLDADGQANFLDALEERALDYEERAAGARDEAREHAADAPSDHPIRGRVQ